MKKVINTLLLSLLGLGLHFNVFAQEPPEVDIAALDQAIQDACPQAWEDLRSEITPASATVDVWSGNATDKAAFVTYLQTNMETPPDADGLETMALDVLTVAAECATRRVVLLDALIKQVVGNVSTSLTAVAEELGTPNVCPPEYIYVPANPDVGTTDAFCVAIYEMKNVGNIATSQYGGIAWRNISQEEAKTACQAVSVAEFEGSFDLISNPEWMTIARNIDQVPNNWSDGVVGSGTLNRGRSDNNGVVATQTDASCVYEENDICSSTGTHLYKRTHLLSTGRELWDFASNVYEWVDWTLDSTLGPAPTTCSSGSTELSAVTCADLAAKDYMPSDISWGSVQGTGKVGNISGTVAMDAAKRGGKDKSKEEAGIYGLWIDSKGDGDSKISFRCVYRPVVETSS